MTSECPAMMDDNAFDLLMQASNFEISPCVTQYDFEDRSRFAKLNAGISHQSQINALVQQIPNMMSAHTLSTAYAVSFPAGLPHTLTQLKQGGFSTMIRGESGKFVGTASLYELGSHAALLNAFSAMSIVTGQYFLAEINDKMQMMNQKLDKILEFLYGDKKAELMAEVSFTKYAFQNFTSIMSHDHQRTATIISVQESKKVAMKDIEFYQADLESAVNEKAGSYSELDELTNRAFQIKNCLDLSMQLYVMGSLLEVYYSENYDADYLLSVENMVAMYIDKCHKRALASFSVLNRRIADYKAKPLEKFEKSINETRITAQIDQLDNGEDSELRKTLHSALYASTQKSEYYLTSNGNVYCKIS